MPEEIGIPQHVRKILDRPGMPLSSTMTLPHLRPRKDDISGSLPNDKFPFYRTEKQIAALKNRKTSSSDGGNLSAVKN